MDVLILLVAVMVLILVVVRRPQAHERALLLNILAGDLAARIINDNPRASWLQHHAELVESLKVHPSLPTMKPAILNRAATGALVRLGRMSNWHTLAATDPKIRG